MYPTYCNDRVELFRLPDPDVGASRLLIVISEDTEVQSPDNVTGSSFILHLHAQT